MDGTLYVVIIYKKKKKIIKFESFGPENSLV